MRREEVNGRVQITARLSPELLERLEQEAWERDVSRNYIIEKAVEAWLKENAVA